ncbi:MAG: CDP-diacylglycerol--glycerol-3-phosphate 3-phosphatidyltransferase [Oligoflexia bacterium]|nr:CDP-diacylglycerol--glycerol-3-phosphate 3-phosphatidyltransferase [Oligoflexia bacterium]
MVRKIPNWLTLLRLGLIPLFVILLIDPSPFMLFMATAIFIFAALTDLVDGYLARRFGAESDLGKLLDPLADKILVLAALVMLVAQRSDFDGSPWVPGWLVVLVLAREVWVTGLRGIAASRGMVLAANSAGKLKSGFQMVAIVLLLLHDFQFRFFGISIASQTIGVNLLLLSVVVSYWGALEYTSLVLSEALEKE